MEDLKTLFQSKLDMSSDDADRMVSFFRFQELLKKEHLKLGNEKCDRVVFIRSGVMRNYHIDEAGNEIVNYMVCDGDFNTIYPSFINKTPSPEYIQAVTDCELLSIDHPGFKRLKNESPLFNKVIEKIVAEGLQCKEERILSYMTEDALTRYVNLLHKQPKIILHSPMRYVASYLAMERETLSRIRNRLS